MLFKNIDDNHWIPNSVPRVAAANLQRASVMFHCNQIAPDPQSEPRSFCLDLHIMVLTQYILIDLMTSDEPAFLFFFIFNVKMW